jgi:hypothetical protein
MTTHLAAIGTLALVPPATRDGGVPAVGWTRVAMALRPLAEGDGGALIVEFQDADHLVIDWGRGVYWWSTPLERMQLRPKVLRVRRESGFGAAVPFMQQNPARLDALLWAIGHHAFPGEASWWQTGGSRYRATAWPNFTELDHSPEDVRMTALLSATAMTPEELASVGRVSVAEAHGFINALDLMGLVVEVPFDGTVVAATPEGSRPGIFARLRARMGI